jgi:hypothetical protein
MLLLASRQSGKSTVAAAVSLQVALLEASSLVLLLSPSLRQSGELFRKVVELYRALGRPVATVMESALRLELANDSRIVSLPGTEATIRGYSGAKLLVIDEAARVPDDLYRAVRPMLAVSHGRMICLSTPFGKRGFFYDEWAGSNKWERVKITADACPRIEPEFLAEERTALGQRWYRQEYECSFEDHLGQIFDQESIDAAFSRRDIRPLVVGTDDDDEPVKPLKLL